MKEQKVLNLGSVWCDVRNVCVGGWLPERSVM